MGYENSRTARYEAFQDHIYESRKEAIDLATEARAYVDFSGEIALLRSRGAIADRVAKDIVSYCENQSTEAREKAKIKNQEADTMERDGMP